MSSAIEVLKKYSTSCLVCKYDGGNQCKASGGEFGECKPAQDLFKRIKEQGAIEELENILNWLELCSKGKNRVNTLPLIKIGLCKDVIDKRLGELKGEQK